MADDRKILCLFDVDGTLTPARKVSKHLVDVVAMRMVQVITPEMKEFMMNLKKKVVVGIVGGSDYGKMQEQMGGDDGKHGDKILRLQNFCVLKIVTKMYDYVFSENGLVAYKSGELIAMQVSCITTNISYLHPILSFISIFCFKNITTKMGEEKLQTFINFCLCYMSGLKLPKKRSVFHFC